jgi:hypothetical protein
MKNGWRWVIGIVLGLVIIGFLWAGGSSRQAYRVARGAINARAEFAQDRIDFAEEMALASVDLALKLAGDLPSQQAKADLVKQDIQEISDRLNEAAELHGEESLDSLNQTIDSFNNTLNTVEDASQEAENRKLNHPAASGPVGCRTAPQFLITGKQ